MTTPSSAPDAPEVPAWERRFRAARVSLPDWAEDAPDRCVYVGNASGVFEVYAWDRATGEQRQVTRRTEGTSHAAIDPSGEWVWWFADTDGDEFGTWVREPFAGGADPEPAVPGLEPGYPAGLELGRGGTAVVGSSADDETTVWWATPGEAPRLLYRHAEQAEAAALSRDGSLLALDHSEHGDSRRTAVRVLRTADGSTVADLWDGPERGLGAIAFAPAVGDTRLLVEHERRGRPELLLWDVASGEQVELELDLPGELSADWYPDGAALLVVHEHAGRSTLHRYDLARRSLEDLPTPPGVVTAAGARPDGTVEYSWSSSEHPPVVRSTTGDVVLAPPGDPAPPSVPSEDVWVEGPGGRIHALLSRPAGEGPYPVVVDVHGGPTWHDTDSFAAGTAAWVDHGFAVLRVNYRGSTGYGTAWRDALEASVGLTELEDVVAVRDALVEQGVLDPERVVLAGGSWGGYLTLLGLGTSPDRWALGLAAVPVADYVAAYEDEMEPLKAFDRSLFGGSPAQVPEKYERASPITYVDAVRVPVLVMAGENDPRCPIRQIENYLARLAERGVPHEVYRYDAGHGSLVVEERIRQVRAELDFVRRQLPGAPAMTT
ncbi:S9 family peptidase [Vallicoccus soli]|uniref:S9 family peptidase n=1 Tax=Vallicoccus soli TaxID=2339232 RepID=UPI001C49990F|nr:prolyl oligopeptidase family serine peptidase [Vallicoccus soli]